MSRGTSPARDKRIIHLAAEVAETRDRKVPFLLLKLKCELDLTSQILFSFIKNKSYNIKYYFILPTVNTDYIRIHTNYNMNNVLCAFCLILSEVKLTA